MILDIPRLMLRIQQIRNCDVDVKDTVEALAADNSSLRYDLKDSQDNHQAALDELEAATTDNYHAELEIKELQDQLKTCSSCKK